jgi:hypothetical protein
MNVIVNDATRPVELTVLLTGMLIMSVALLIWARRKGLVVTSTGRERPPRGAATDDPGPTHTRGAR